MYHMYVLQSTKVRGLTTVVVHKVEFLSEKKLEL